GTIYQLVWNSYDLGMERVAALGDLEEKSYVDVQGKWHVVHRNNGGSLTKTTTMMMRNFKPVTAGPTNEDNKAVKVPRASVYKNANDVDLLLKAMDGEKLLRNLRERVKLTDYSGVMDAYEEQQSRKRGIDGTSDKDIKRPKSEDVKDEEIKKEIKNETEEVKAESTEGLDSSFAKLSGGANGTSQNPIDLDDDGDQAM
ncbi:hypothetical protein BGZ54_008714, partial [Gamsiella multidivaricata]